jgi:plasmid stabilization system protein ParE
MARIIWAPEALAKIDFIAAYIDQFDPDAARRTAAHLITAGNSLEDFPRRGRPAGNGHRELVTVRPYIIRYRIKGSTIFIADVRHAMQLGDPD